MSQSDIAISVRGLSKAYTISHQADGSRSRRPTFRDVVTSRLRDPFRKTPKETFWALKDVSFEVKKGDVVGIIGRNGAGKSTLLKILSRITKPTSGEIDVYGRIGSLLEVGTGFHPELTGRENIFLNGAILGMTRPEIRKQFDAIVDFAEVEQFLDTPVKRYSSGMYVRLAFAVAAHLNSDILVIDEVLAVGDAEFQQKCLGKMKDLSSYGRTVLFVSHNMAAVRALCSRGVVLQAGRVLLEGTAADCANSYTAYSDSVETTILSSLLRSSPDVQLTRVCLNGSDSSLVQLATGSQDLEIEIKGRLLRGLRIDLEAKLVDEFGSCIGFFSPGHDRGVTEWHDAGAFSLRRSVRLPERLNSGRLLLSIALTHHNVSTWADLPQCARLIVEGTPTKTGRILSSREGAGWIFLSESDDESLIRNPRLLVELPVKCS